MLIQEAASFAAILSFIAIGCFLWDQLPEEIVVHFNVRMQPDDLAPKSFVVFGIPAFLAGMQAVCVYAANSMEKTQSAIRTVTIWIVPFVTISIYSLMYSFALGARPDVGMWMQLVVGVLLVTIGNTVPKTTSSFWIMRSDTITPDAGRKILRFRGYCLVLCGAAICVCAISGVTDLFFGIVILAGVLPAAYAIRHIWLARRT